MPPLGGIFCFEEKILFQVMDLDCFVLNLLCFARCLQLFNLGRKTNLSTYEKDLFVTSVAILHRTDCM